MLHFCCQSFLTLLSCDVFFLLHKAQNCNNSNVVDPFKHLILIGIFGNYGAHPPVAHSPRWKEPRKDKWAKDQLRLWLVWPFLVLLTNHFAIGQSG